VISSGRSIRARWPWWGVAAGLVLAVLFAVGGFLQRSRPIDRGTVPIAAVSPPPDAAPPEAGRPVPPAAAPTGSLPLRLRVEQLHVDAPVVPVVVAADGALGVPADPRTVGWWAGGPLPGSLAGTAVLDGHVDSAAAGPGALFELRRVTVGDTVTVSGDNTPVTYRITGVREYDKGELPASGLFVRTGAPRLALVTCGGPFDAGSRHYRDNIVAFGVPVSRSAPG